MPIEVEKQNGKDPEPEDKSIRWYISWVGDLTKNVKFVLTIFSLLLIASLLYQITADRADTEATQQLLNQGIEQRDALQEQAELIIDCTAPGGDCYERGQENTAEAVATLNLFTQYSVVCGEREQGEKDILRCINEEVKLFMEVQDSQNP